MARPLRIDRPGAWYHVTARGIDRRTIYRADSDRSHWLELMPEFVQMFRLRLHAYVLMDNHFHLLVEALEGNLSVAMQWLQTSYSMWFNRKHGRVGPLFQGRFKAVVVEPQSWGLSVSRYLHLNPIRVKALGLGKQDRAADRLGVRGKAEAAMVQERLKRLRVYGGSSFRAYVGRVKTPEWLSTQTLLELGGRGTEAQRRMAYRDYVEEAVREGLEASPWEQLVGRVVLGSHGFVARMQRVVSGNGREQPQFKEVKSRPEWKHVVAAVERQRGLSWEEMRCRRGDWGRDLAWYLGRTECGLGLKALGATSGGVDYATVSAAINRMKGRLTKDRDFAVQVQRIQTEWREWRQI